MTNFEDLAMRNELVEFFVEKFIGPLKGGFKITRKDIESIVEWLQLDADDILILRSDVMKVLKSHLDKNTIYNDQFQKLLSDIDYIEPRFGLDLAGKIGKDKEEHSFA